MAPAPWNAFGSFPGRYRFPTRVDDVARRRAGIGEPPMLTRLLDEALADIERSRRSMVRVVSLLTTTVGADAPAVHQHGDHQHHGHRHDHRHGRAHHEWSEGSARDDEETPKHRAITAPGRGRKRLRRRGRGGMVGSRPERGRMPPKFSISNILVGPSGEEFFKGFVHRSYPKGGLVSSGDSGENGILMVMSGRLRMFPIGENREPSLFHLGPGDMFCMHSGCLVEATEPCEPRITNIATFDRKLRENPHIAWAPISIFGRAPASFLRTIEDLMFPDIKQRVADFSIDRAHAGGRPSPRVVDVENRLDVEEIAESIGSSRRTTSIAIDSLIKKGLLQRRGRGSLSIPSLDSHRPIRRSTATHQILRPVSFEKVCACSGP